MDKPTTTDAKRARAQSKDRRRRLQADALLASLMKQPEPANRAERREREKRFRRAASTLRASVREIKEKRAYRAWRKTRREGNDATEV